MRSLFVVVLPLVLLACANLPPRAGSDETGRQAGELYLKTLRWDGAQSSADLVALEVRPEYLMRIEKDKLDDNLKIGEYEARELVHQADGRVQVQAEIDWYVQPEITVHHKLVRIDLRYQNDAWKVVGLEGGPIPIKPLPLPGQILPDGGAPAEAQTRTAIQPR